MSPRRYLTGLTAIFTMVLMAWAIAEIIRHGVTLWTSAVLVYLALVGITLWISRGDTTVKVSPSASTTISTDKQPPPAKGVGETGQTENTAQEVILNAIRSKGKAKRHDLLPQVGLSRSSLGRLLDQMEAKGLIRQEGRRKASYYVLAEKSGQNL